MSASFWENRFMDVLEKHLNNETINQSELDKMFRDEPDLLPDIEVDGSNYEHRQTSLECQTKVHEFQGGEARTAVPLHRL